MRCRSNMDKFLDIMISYIFRLLQSPEKVSFCALYIQVERSIVFPVKKSEGLNVLMCCAQWTQSTSHRALHFMCYKQQIKTQAVTALHFTASYCQWRKLYHCLFPSMISEWWCKLGLMTLERQSFSLILKGWHQNLTFMVDVFDRLNTLLPRSIFRCVLKYVVVTSCYLHLARYLLGKNGPDVPNSCFDFLTFNSIMVSMLTLPLFYFGLSLACPSLTQTTGGKLK